MSFGIYIRQLIGVILSSTLALGLLAGGALLVFGELNMSPDGDIEIARFDGLWLVIGLPLVSMLVFVILSPLSFLISRLLTKRRND